MAKINLDIWHARVSRALDLQSKKRKERLEINKLYQGTFLGSPFDTKTKSELNFLFEYVRLVRSVTYARSPHIFARAYHSRYVAFAETMEKVLNYYVAELRTKSKIRSCLGDAVMQPPGFIGIGYRGQIETTGRKREELLPELRNIKQPEQAGIFDETIKNNDVFMRYISSWNVVWPDGYHDLRDSPYLIEIEDIRLTDLYSNPMYKNSKFKIQGGLTHTVKQARHQPLTMKADIPLTSQRTPVDEETIVKRLFHIWDKRSKRRFTITDGLRDDTLFERPWNELTEGFLIYPLIFNEIPQTDVNANSYPLSDVIPMLPQLRDLALINDAIIRHGKRAGTVILARKGGLGPEEITNIQNAGDVDLILLESISEEHVRTFTTPATPADWYRIRSLIIEDLMRISGFQQLLSQIKGIETATESENLKVGESLLVSEKVDIVEDFLRDIFRGLAGLIWQFISRQRIAGIIGEDQLSEDMWPALPDDIDEQRRIIQQELEFRIEAGSTRPPKDEAVERKQWMDLVGTIQASFPGRLKTDKTIEQILKKFDFKDVENLVIKYDEQETAVAQEENKLLMQGIRQLVSPNENHMLHAQVHAQVYQTPGLQPTPQMDEHMDKHAQFMEQQNPKANPQRGDTKVSPQSTRPEQARRGVPDNVDLVGGATNVNKGVGANV